MVTDLSSSTTSGIREALVHALREIAKQKCPAEFSDDINVLRECDLDSQHGLELACDLSDRLGIDIPANENPLVEDSGPSGRKRARKFGEVVDYLAALGC